MSDSFKVTFWRCEWHEDVAAKLGHKSCIRILKFKPDCRFIFAEQIGIRIDNWRNFVDEIRGLEIGDFNLQ